MVTPICGQIKNVIGIMRYITNMIQNNINTTLSNVPFQNKLSIETENIIILNLN